MHDNFWGGMYNGANQMQEMKNQEPVPPPGEERLTYEQYKKERQEQLKAQNRLPPQEWWKAQPVNKPDRNEARS